RGTEAEDASDKSVGHGRQAPQKYRQGKSPARSQPIHDSPDEQQPGRISYLEGKNDVAVIDLVPVEFRLERGLQQANYLPVDIIDRSREEEQTADHPAAVSCRRNWRGRFDRNVRDTDFVNHLGHKPLSGSYESRRIGLGKSYAFALIDCRCGKLSVSEACPRFLETCLQAAISASAIFVLFCRIRCTGPDTLIAPMGCVSSKIGAPMHATPGSFSDRKSTRLNSSHLVISYAVFCLKKKTSQALRCSTR